MLADRAGATHGKESRGHTFLVDGGLRHQFAAMGNFGQVIRKTNYPVAVTNRMGVPGAETGDLVAVVQAGACRMTPVLQRSSAIRHQRELLM